MQESHIKVIDPHALSRSIESGLYFGSSEGL